MGALARPTQRLRRQAHALLLRLLPFLPLLLALPLALASADARAQAVPEITPMHLGGVNGAWVPEPALRQILLDRAELDALREKIELANREGYELRRQALLLADAAEQRAVVGRELDKALRSEAALRAAAEDELDAWYRSPWFLVGVGAAVVVAVELAALAAVGEL